MVAGQFTYYICHEIGCIVADYYNVCNLPNVGYHRIKDSPYRLILQAY